MKSIRHEVWINASATRVFDAISTTPGLDAWWGKALSAKPELGQVVEFDHALGAPMQMRITQLEPGRSLSWRCISDFSDPGNPASEWLGHSLSFELNAAPNESTPQWLRNRLGIPMNAEFTVLTFTHTGWDTAARWFAFCNNGWGMALDQLKRSCETS